jgi:transcriptional regulator with XRE-family HTH domain
MPRTSTPIDVIVGKNIRFHRLARGLSQQALGEKLGVSFQQIQKYEKGTNRVGAGRLTAIAQALDLPISVFFEGAGSSAHTADNDAAHNSPSALLAMPHALRLAQAFTKLREPKTRLLIVHLVEEMVSLANAPKSGGSRRQ